MTSVAFDASRAPDKEGPRYSLARSAERVRAQGLISHLRQDRTGMKGFDRRGRNTTLRNVNYHNPNALRGVLTMQR